MVRVSCVSAQVHHPDITTPNPVDLFDLTPSALFFHSEKEWKSRKTPEHSPREKKRRRSRKNQAKARRKYEQYLQSDKWRAFRAEIIAKRGAKCERCGESQKPLHLHHLTYVRIFNELPEDVQVLCGRCHRSAHPGKVF